MNTDLPEWPSTIPVPLVDRQHEFRPLSDGTLMESGRMRIRRASLLPQEFIKVRWNFTEDQYETFEQFFQTTILNGELSFLLVTYDPSSEEFMVTEVHREVAFVEGKYGFTKSDNLFAVSATLEVVDVETVLIEDPSSALPALEMSYPLYGDEPEPCRDEVMLTFRSLGEDTVYMLEIAASSEGNWVPFIYFSLQTEEERLLKTKQLILNNDFDGYAWFRARRLVSSAGIHNNRISRAGNPAASLIPAPIISVSNLTLLEHADDCLVYDLSDPTGFFTGGKQDRLRLRPMDAYRIGDLFWPIPISVVEDPMMFNTIKYYAISRKYGCRWYDANNSGDLATVYPGVLQGIHIVTISGADGATHKWTRDGSDPTETTEIPIRNGVANNAYVTDDAFKGIVIGRSFKDGCRSPACLIGIDKVYWELPYVDSYIEVGGAIGTCDLPRVIDGNTEISGQDCGANYGGTDGLDEEIKFHEIPPQPSNIVFGSSIGVVYSAWSFGSQEQLDYLGWTNHVAFMERVIFDEIKWRREDRWLYRPRNHQWAITASSIETLQVGFVLPDSVPSGTFSYAGVSGYDTPTNDRMNQIFGLTIPGEPHPPISVSRMDIVTSPLGYVNLRDEFWNAIIIGLVFPPPPVIPPPIIPPPPNLELNVENWEEYAIAADMTTLTLTGGNGWSTDPWQITTYVSGVAVDDFEFYAAAVITDSGASLNKGDVWASAWVIKDALGTAYGDDFESYVVGVMDSLNFNGGTGFYARWDIPPSTDGLEDWESNLYEIGVLIGENSGMGWSPSVWKVQSF
jgi:hypothetical protein